uniref:Secreted protein n=1 Tax=Knipowitschia caucasica TaxID=637954 RepID=A0AAV2J163_KNICA
MQRNAAAEGMLCLQVLALLPLQCSHVISTCRDAWGLARMHTRWGCLLTVRSRHTLSHSEAAMSDQPGLQSKRLPSRRPLLLH